ncbi:MAG: hypothetical protein ACREAA_04390 [Candidatus Polarisedimenticolia bacterium]
MTCVLLAMMPATAVLAAKDRPYRIAGAQRGPDKEWVPVDVMEQANRGVACQIRYLAPEARTDALKSAVNSSMELFPGRAAEKNGHPGYIVFVLEMANQTTEDVMFNPGQARMVTEKGDMKFPLDYTAVHERLSSLGPGAPEVDEVAAAVFDRTVTLRPGGSVRKLLVFDAPREDTFKTIQVRLHEINVGTEDIGFLFPFRKFFE